jgi:hypothetical protein
LIANLPTTRGKTVSASSIQYIISSREEIGPWS